MCCTFIMHVSCSLADKQVQGLYCRQKCCSGVPLDKALGIRFPWAHRCQIQHAPLQTDQSWMPLSPAAECELARGHP